VSFCAQSQNLDHTVQLKCYGEVVIFSIIAAIITLGNVLWYGSFGPTTADSLHWLATFNQIIAGLFGVLGFVKFSGRRWRPNYQIGKPPIWTLGRAFTYVALVGSVGSILLTLSRFIGW